MKLINWNKETYLLLIVLFVSGVLRIFHLDFQSLWLDEIYTLNDTNPNLSIPEVYDAACKEAAPAVYSIIVNLAFKIFGYTSFVLRMVSVVFGLAGILAIYFLGKEIHSKKVGIYCSILIAVNYFHIYYSQEGRIYTFLFLVTIVSFYLLIKFIKAPTFKSALLYGISSSLMLYGHYFALFTLVAQYLILLFFVIQPFNITRSKFFLYCFIAGITNLVLFLPLNYGVLTRVSGIKSFWISKPDLDVFTQVFKDFFGQSEIVLFFIFLLFLIYFIQLFKEKEIVKFKINPIEEKFVFGFLILFIWILITILLPLVRSYTTVPMLVNRYFMDILPAIIIIVAIGLNYILNQIVRYMILCFMVTFSLVDIVIVKDYYNKIDKAQFREVSEFVKNKNVNKEPVLSNLSWWLQYWLQNEKVNMKLIDSSIDSLAAGMMRNEIERKSFWYIEISSHPLEMTEATKKYLNNNFVIKNNRHFFKAFAIEYSTVSDSIREIDNVKYNPVKSYNGDNFRCYVDVFEVGAETIITSGYAFFEGQSSINTEFNVILFKQDDKKIMEIPSRIEKRDDLAPYFKSKFDLSNGGFNAKVYTNNLAPGNYQLGIILKNKDTKKEGLVLFDKFFTKK